VLRAPAVVLLLGVAVGCGGASGRPGDGGATGGVGPGGTGTGGMAGSACLATVPATGGIGPDGLPFCVARTRPSDPMNVTPGGSPTTDGAVSVGPVSDGAVSDAAAADAALDAAALDAAARDAAALDAAARISTVPNTSNDDDNCNMLYQVFLPKDGGDGGVEDCFTETAPLCAPQPFAADGGEVTPDGGPPELPAGGTLVDGDYQLVRYRSNVASGHSSKRTIGIYDGATYVEWAAFEKGGSAFGGDQILRLNTTMSATGSVWKVAAVNCGSLAATGYGYTASGTELELYDFDASGRVQNVYTYQRTCSR
jgi:hypothetical protein